MKEEERKKEKRKIDGFHFDAPSCPGAHYVDS